MRIPIILTGLALAAPALAQDTSPDIAIAAAKNQQGLLEFCADAGHVSSDAAQTQARVIATFPPPADPGTVEDAYRKGQAGIVSAMQIAKPVQEAAADQGLTLSDLCRQLAAAADQAAAQLSGQ